MTDAETGRLARLRARARQAERIADTASRPPGPRHAPSLAQQRFWFLAQAAPDDASYNVPIGIRLRGRVTPAALREALRLVVSRHEILRTRYEATPHGCVQVVVAHDEIVLELPVHSVADESAARVAAEKLGRTPFDLAGGPPVRAVLFRIDVEDHLLVLCMHHIAVDEVSVEVVLDELGEALAGEAVRADPPPQHVDYALRQRDRMAGPEVDDQVDWWRARLRGAEPVELVGGGAATDGREVEFTVPTATTHVLRRVAGENRSTLFVTVLSVLLALLRRYSGQTDLCVGTPVSVRDLDEPHDLDRAVGPYLNTVVVRADLSRARTFADLVQQVRRAVLDTLPYREAPYERVVDAVGRDQGAGRRSLFHVLFSMGKGGLDDLRWTIPGLRASRTYIPLGFAKAELSVHLREQPDGSLSGSWQVDNAGVDRRAAERMTTHFVRLAHALGHDANSTMDDAPMLGADERAELAVAWNDPPRAGAILDEVGVHEYFVRQAERTPDAPAVAQGARTLTYHEVERWSAAVAGELRDDGEFVAVCTPRGIAGIVAILGVLRAGRAYVPLDADFPAARLRYALQDTAARTVLVHGEPPESLRAAVADLPDPPRLLDVATCTTPTSDLGSVPGGTRPCYVIYTSGTTGVPKGVELEHRALTHYAAAIVAALGAELARPVGELTFATVSTLAADLGNTCIFPALISGACVHVLDHETATEPDRFSQYLHSHAIDVLKIVPSHFEALHNAAATPRMPGEALILGGEAPSRALVSALATRRPACRIFNHYGPTETCVGSLMFAVPDGYAPVVTVPIGSPLGGTRIAVLDDQGNPVPVGVPGELYIGGPGVARRYLNQPDLTEQRFVTIRGVSGELTRYYRTGDIVRTRSDGTVEFVGRRDSQVKVRGHRVELSEIESVIAELTGAVQVLVTASSQGLAAYVVGEIDPGDLVARVRSRLPSHMVPSSVTAVARIPRLPNGKPDLLGLSAAESIEPAAPAVVDDDERRLLDVWNELLGHRVDRVDQDFFAAGGHSLLLIQLVGRIRAEFGLEVTVRDCVEHPTVRELAAVLHQSRVAPKITAVARAQASSFPASFAQERMWFMHQLYPGSTNFVVPITIRLRGRLDTDALVAALRDVVTRHEVLRTGYVRRSRRCEQVIVHANGRYLQVGGHAAENFPDALALATSLTNQPFDLTTPPVRADLIRVAEDDHLFALTVHHIAMDGWSVGVVSRELGDAYRAAVEGTAKLAPPAVQFADFAVWQREQLTGPRLSKLLTWWIERIVDAEQLRLPTDRPRPATHSERGDVVMFGVDARTGAALRQIGDSQGATPFMVMLSVFAVTLHQLSGQHDLSLGTVVSGRLSSELDGTVGPFVNSVVLRLDLGGDPTFTDVVHRIRGVVLDALAHQDAPFEKVVEAVNPPRDPSRAPLFQVAFTSGVPGARTVRWSAGRLRAEPVTLPFTLSKYDMTMDIEEQPDDSFRCRWHYATALFDRASIVAMTRLYSRLADGLAASAQTPLSGTCSFGGETHRASSSGRWSPSRGCGIIAP